MVRHWLRAGKRDEGREVRDEGREDRSLSFSSLIPQPSSLARGWRRSIVINGLGALATALVLAVFLLTKFIHGAWIVVVVVPLLVLMFKAIHHYYGHINAQLQLGEA